jgi:RNA polymerase sigma-70 factor (ECF subfamily)
MTDTARQLREVALRRAVLAGDETAWRVWYDESFSTIYRFVNWRIPGKLDLTEEILQESWLIAVQRIRDFDPHQGAFLDWVRGIAANVLRNRLRQNPGVLTTGMIEEVAGPEATVAISPCEPSVRITEVLQVLPVRYADVLRAKYLEQRSVSEIAVAWNETTKAVESLLSRARQAFRDAFGTD